MHALIDTTNHIAIATHAEHSALAALAFIQFANVDTVVVPLDSNRPFAQFDAKQLDKIYQGVIAAIDKPTTFTYTDTIMRCREAIKIASHLRLPFSLDTLNAQARCIDFTDEQPYMIDTRPNAITPIRTKTWHHSPQRNRARQEIPAAKSRPESDTPRTGRRTFNQFAADSQAEAQARGLPQPDAVATHKGIPVAIEHKTAPKAPPAPPAKAVPLPPKAKAAPVAPASAPSAPKAAPKPRGNMPVQNGIHRPAPGGKTAVVWDIADKLAAKAGKSVAADPKGFRKSVVEACLKAGVNSSTAATQYGHWANFNGVSKK